MQVITLNPIVFEAHAERLAKCVTEGSDTRYDAIVGVRRGGSIVCDAFLRHFPKGRYGKRYDVALHRPSTKHKEGKMGRLLRHLPYPLLDAMRKAEAIILSLQRKISGAASAPEVKIPEGLAEIMTDNRHPEILVIDDAIDSGDTLYAIVETLRKKNPDAKVSVAVMTETTDHPRIRADYTLYRNRTLIRFPWSKDYKKNGEE